MALKIMIQGTMSGVGKSLLTAGLCRIFAQDGWKTAPFKSQNMALNSYITPEGLEIGRAQAMQAEAAGIKPLAAMNPVLLKPVGEMNSQVIVRGEVYKTMSARAYFQYKKNLLPCILDSFKELEEAYEVIVVEGAGSPAEINLKSEDIVNMGLAKLIGAPVLLAGDIDRGGVFAQLAGTVMLLPEEERRYIKGLIINKFRGDQSILDPGTAMIEELTKIPVTGVVPYMPLDLEDEDSFSHRFAKGSRAALIDLAVIRYPTASNITDFHVFEQINGVSLRYVAKETELGSPDLIFLPGSKNTVRDLLWMRKEGLEAALLKKAASGTAVFGICGGYQMLGRSIIDEEQETGGEVFAEELSSFGAKVRGLGLLPLSTKITNKKRRSLVKGHFLELSGILTGMSNLPLSGYEIHMGQTIKEEEQQSMSKIWEEGAEAFEDGICLDNLYGSYLHGLFDEGEAALCLVRCLAKAKGLNEEDYQGADYRRFKEAQYDLLADALRKHLDLPGIYEIMKAGMGSG